MFKKITGFLYHSEQVTFKPFLFFRISVGLLVLMHFLTVIADIGLLFGPRGIFPAEITEMHVDDFIITRTRLMDTLQLSAPVFNFLFNLSYILFACFIITGFLTRFSALAMLLLNTALIKSNVFFSYGVDYFTSMSLFYLILFPTNEKYALDDLLFKGRFFAREQYVYFRRFIQLHLCVAYFFSGLNKVIGYNWRNGEAIWKTIHLPYANLDFRIGVDWLSGYPLLLVLLGWGVIILELCYPAIYFRQMRKKWLYAVILMHLGIAFIVNLYFFSAIMIIWNITAFYAFDKAAAVSLAENRAVRSS